MIGKTISHYRILERIGAGGMGQVFLAEDERLHRKVAFKVLPDAFALDPDRLARFEREARTLAALNHPHIAQIYGVEDNPQVRALVMELVPGESLAARLERGPVPLREALEYARQAADGLSTAHDKGIVHRDLKPANIQVTPEGVVKVLDFGLAKPAETGAAAAAATLTSPAQMTAAGIVLGTAAYMSPEQAKGAAVDGRTDVWSLGATLYEMLTGTRPFPGPTVTETLAQILEREPDWAKLPPETPAAVRMLLRRCLRKDARQRYRDMADVRLALEDALAAAAGDSGLGITAFPSEKPDRTGQKILPIALAGLSLVLLAALIWSVASNRPGEENEPLLLSLVLPPAQELVPGIIAISPDGRDLVYPAVSEEGTDGLKGRVARLFHRRLSESAGRALPGTEGAITPMFSPDGQWIAFYSAMDVKLKRIALSGGGPATIADVPPLQHQSRGVWTSDGYILFGDPNGPVRRVAAAGGPLEIVVPRDVLEKGEQGFILPMAIPGGNGVLFGLNPGPGIAAYKDGRRLTLFKEGSQPRFFDAGNLLFWRRTGNAQMDLSIVPFDVDRVEPSGTPITVISEESGGGGIVYDISRNGTLVYRAAASEFPLGRFSWLPIDGASTSRSIPRSAEDIGTIYSPRVSPDGRHLLYHIAKPGTPPRYTLISLDLESGAKRNLSSGRNFWAIWSHDGKRIIYQEPVDAPGGGGLQWKPADGSGPSERLTSSQSWQQPQFVTRDGRFLVYQETGGLGTQSSSLEENYDLWLLPLVPRGDPRPLLRTQANERLAHLSPDQRWMAYVLDERGQSQIWIRSFPEGASAIQVTQDGGTEPVWAPDGKTLFYRDSTGMRLFSVPVVPGTIPQFGTPVFTSGHWVAPFTFGRQYDISPDGKAMLMLPQGTFGRTLNVVLNFDTLVRRKLGRK